MTYSPRRRSWDVVSLMTPVTADQVRCTPGSAKEHEARLWMDLVAEYEARLLLAELERRGVAYSREFRAFLDAWALDEEKHAEGLLRLYSLVCREPLSSLRTRLSRRSGRFGPLGHVLDDEFKLTVLFAYDEAMSTHGYSEDIPFYAGLGPPAFETLIRELKNDEAVHYANALELLVIHLSPRSRCRRRASSGRTRRIGCRSGVLPGNVRVGPRDGTVLRRGHAPDRGAHRESDCQTDVRSRCSLSRPARWLPQFGERLRKGVRQWGGAKQDEM